MKIGFLGCGNMGSALAKGIGINKTVEILACDHNESKLRDICKKIGAASASSKILAEKCDFIFLGVKPNAVRAAVKEITPFINKNAIIVSMAAGVKISTLEDLINRNTPIIRIIPNTPVEFGKGMTIYAANESVSTEKEAQFLSFMSPTGKIDKLPEELIDSACAVSGCGPAFAYMFIQALADGATKCGISSEKALVLAAQTVGGAAEVVLKSGKSPEKLKDEVCSPGGSTLEGVAVLESALLKEACIRAVCASFEKTKRLDQNK